jgi:NDP-sugar pyrophosphorylase family protein
MKRAVILAGGRGERLRPLTQDKPKCMVEILGSPVMAYQLRWLRAYGIDRVVVACGYMHEIIQDYFGNGAKYGVSIEYLVEEKLLGRGGALKRAWLETMEGESTVLCLNGDNVCNLSIKELLEFHLAQKPLATIVSVPLRSPYGVIEVSKDDTISGFTEKPELPYGVNAGIYVMDRGIVSKLPDIGDHETGTFPQLAKEGRLKAFRSRCFWRTVDTVKDVNELNSELENILIGSFLEAPRA